MKYNILSTFQSLSQRDGSQQLSDCCKDMNMLDRCETIITIANLCLFTIICRKLKAFVYIMFLFLDTNHRSKVLHELNISNAIIGYEVNNKHIAVTKQLWLLNINKVEGPKLFWLYVNTSFSNYITKDSYFPPQFWCCKKIYSSTL